MPRYRHLVTFAGALLLLGGILGLIFALMLDSTLWPKVRGVVGGTLSIYLGGTLVVAGNSGRLPGWITKVFGDPGELD